MVKKLLYYAFGVLLSVNQVAYALEEQPQMDELALCKIQITDNPGYVSLGKKLLKNLYTYQPLIDVKPLSSGKASVAFFPQAPISKPIVIPVQENLKISKENMGYIIWTLYGIAGQLNKGYFTEGTFVIEDKDLRLFKLMRDSGYAYKRISSHFKAYKTQHYGMDIENLPCGKHHILFGELANGRIFIKPENHGLSGIQDTLEHGKEYVVAQARKIESIRYLFNMLSDQDPSFKKERISPELLAQFEKLLKEIEIDKETIKQHMETAKNFGVQKIISILKEYMNEYKPLQSILAESGPVNLSGSWVLVTQDDVDKSKHLLNDIVYFLEDIAVEDNLYQRTGSEIVLTQADLNKALGIVSKETPEQTEVD